MKPLKVAIVMGGGVSLGSFSGGALAGALRRIDREARKADLEMQIDVLSGASAGALSLCVLLRKLAWPDEPYDPEDEDSFWQANVEDPQHRAWVRGIGIQELAGKEGEARGSLFSSAALEDLAREMMGWERAPGDGELNPRGLLASRVHFLSTLMNLNGIPIVSDRLEENPALVDAKAATLFKDARTFCLDVGRANGDGGREGGTEEADRAHGGAPWERAVHRSRSALAEPGTWLEMAETALAAAAFPIAFQPRPISRRQGEFGSLWPWRPEDDGPAARALRNKLWLSPRDDFPFTYGDGGAFNNEPLREAMGLIRHVDGADRDEFERLLLFIDPHLSGTAHDEYLTLHYPTEISDGREVERTLLQSLLGQAGPTVAAITGQAGFQDVREADRTNERLAWRGELRGILRTLVDALPEEGTEALAEEVDGTLGEALGVKGRASLARDDYGVEVERERVRKEEGEEEAPAPGGGRDRLRHSLFALVDQVAGLRDRRVVPVVAVGPLDPESSGEVPQTIPLAGGFLRRFGGFLDEELRAHDFDWGKVKGDMVRLPGSGEGREGGAPAERGSDLEPPAPPSEEAYARARERLVETTRSRYAGMASELASLLEADGGGFRRWLTRTGAAVYTSFRGTERALMKVFDRELGPRLARGIPTGEASRLRGHVRLLIRIEDGRGDSGPSYRLGPGAGAGSADPGVWSSRRAGGAELATWVEYGLGDGESADEAGGRLEVRGGPHLHLSERNGGAEEEGSEAAPALILDRADDGSVAQALPIRIGLGDGSPFLRVLERRRHLLKRAQEPFFSATIELEPEEGSPSERIEWAAIPNVLGA